MSCITEYMRNALLNGEFNWPASNVIVALFDEGLEPIYNEETSTPLLSRTQSMAWQHLENKVNIGGVLFADIPPMIARCSGCCTKLTYIDINRARVLAVADLAKTQITAGAELTVTVPYVYNGFRRPIQVVNFDCRLTLSGKKIMYVMEPDNLFLRLDQKAVDYALSPVTHTLGRNRVVFDQATEDLLGWGPC